MKRQITHASFCCLCVGCHGYFQWVPVFWVWMWIEKSRPAAVITSVSGNWPHLTISLFNLRCVLAAQSPQGSDTPHKHRDNGATCAGAGLSIGEHRTVFPVLICWGEDTFMCPCCVWPSTAVPRFHYSAQEIDVLLHLFPPLLYQCGWGSPPSVPQHCFRVPGSRLRPRLQGRFVRVSRVVKDGAEKSFPPRVWARWGSMFPAQHTGHSLQMEFKKKKKVTPRAEDFWPGVSRACPAMTGLRRHQRTSRVSSINTSNLGNLKV